ncbi:MAG: efflux RND transporter periplasmic adaptor subunit [Saprospiraceae bacterium]|nr:efflux RND transporter periplasmic adaptor subunit [Saprospiraceae bacterium]
MKHFLIAAALAALFLPACKSNQTEADAYGNFESDALLVSAEATGRILDLKAEEGNILEKGAVVASIDSTQLVLRRDQLRASIRAVAAKSPAIAEQLAVYEKQLSASRQQIKTLQREKQRVENLIKADAATTKQLDDINAQIDQVQEQILVITGQRTASGATLNAQKGGILAEIEPLQKQIIQLDDQIARCNVVNPRKGTVLVSYAEKGEIAQFGKPLYKIAGIDTLILRAYLGGDQLGSVKIGQAITVRVDAPDGKYTEYTGTLTWLSEQAEFTPKVIQTKDERVNLVYAMKIKVPNPDGRLKIGMPAEVKL